MYAFSSAAVRVASYSSAPAHTIITGPTPPEAPRAGVIPTYQVCFMNPIIDCMDTAAAAKPGRQARAQQNLDPNLINMMMIN